MSNFYANVKGGTVAQGKNSVAVGRNGVVIQGDATSGSIVTAMPELDDLNFVHGPLQLVVRNGVITLIYNGEAVYMRGVESGPIYCDCD